MCLILAEMNLTTVPFPLGGFYSNPETTNQSNAA
jgi:hypothetical protein